MTLPPFHTFGIVTQLYAPIACLVTTLVYPPRTQNDPLAQPVIPTGDNMTEQVKRTECNVLMTVPALLEEIATSDEAVEILKKLEYVVRAIHHNPPSLYLSTPRPLVGVLYLSRSARSCGLLGCSSAAVMAGQNSESLWQLPTSRISPTVIGCGCVFQRASISGGLHKETIHTSCKSWYGHFSRRCREMLTSSISRPVTTRWR